MRREFVNLLSCPACGDRVELEIRRTAGKDVTDGVLTSRCGRRFPVIAGVPRMLPEHLAPSLVRDHPSFFARHPDLTPGALAGDGKIAGRTLRAFGDEWKRFPEIFAVHERIFHWYFEGADEVYWEGLRVLDAGCGMGRWLHFARRAGAQVVGMDLSPAIDVAAAREGLDADLVQADLRWSPFPPASFDLVYSLGVLHHLEDPSAAVRTLGTLLRPRGELRLYLYRSFDGDPWPRRFILKCVIELRRVTTSLPFGAVRSVAFCIALAANILFLFPRRALRNVPWGDRLTRSLPLVQYADVPFRMLLSEQFDRLVAPIEGRFRREEIEGWLRSAGFQVLAVLPGLGWRAIARRSI